LEEKVLGDYSELLSNTLERNKQAYIECLKGLGAHDSHDIGHGIEGGLEANAQEYLVDLYGRMGADEVQRDPLDEQVIEESLKKYGEGNPGHNLDNRYNVYATFKGQGGKSLLLDGHVDHMPVTEEEAARWTTPPLEPTVRDGKIYGLGVDDMKAGLMAAIMSVRLLKDAGIPLPGDVTIASVCDEEGGGNGSVVATNHGIHADAVVVCEPTNYELIAAHMGWVFFKVEFEGIAVHSGLKLKGVSAIEKAIKVIHAIDEMEHRWLLTYKHPLLPPPSSNVGVISGGEAGSTVPDYCCFQTCVHYLPNVMSRQQVIDEYTATIYRCCEGDEWLKDHKPKISVYQTGNPFEMDLAHPFVASFKQAYREAMGHDVRVVGSPAGCDSRLWLHIAGCPTLQYGPGALEQSHAIDEYVTVEQYLDAIKIYAHLILDWCGGERDKEA